MIQLIAAALGIAGQSLGSYMERKQLETQTKLEIMKIKAQGEVEAAKALAQIEAEYDNMAQANMKTSWKDEYLVLIMTMPTIVSFLVPFIQVFLGIDLAPALKASWELIGMAPDWYQWSVLGIIIATFGLRWAAKGFQMPPLKRGQDNG